MKDIKTYKIGIKEANNNTESIMELRKRLQKLKFKIKWQIKTNH